MIFLDANFLVSYYLHTEEHHERALEIDEEIGNNERIISRSVIAETINVLNNKLKIDKETIEIIYKKLIEDYSMIEDQFFYNKAVKKLISYEKRLPFFDFLYIALMEELRIEKIATFDKHFNNIEGITTVN